MGDLGLHVAHVPLRLGWKPASVYAQLQKIYPTRPDGKGGTAACDTWDNAMLHCTAPIAGHVTPLTLEMNVLRRPRPTRGFSKCWGTDRGVRF